jgi:hypothetical protein
VIATKALGRGDDVDGGGFGERVAVQSEARERVGGLAGDGLGDVETEYGPDRRCLLSGDEAASIEAA